MKTIILTQDYEIFFGVPSGSVEKCMIRPTNYLMDILREHKSSMTVFWDIMHYHTLLNFKKEFPDLDNDLGLIGDQIRRMTSEKHDIQLHIHPHWLDAKYDGQGNWSYNYERYSIHNLLRLPTDSVESITGCIRRCIDILCEFDKDPKKILLFRAGGYHIEPFHELSQAFKENNIYFDSSTIRVNTRTFNDKRQTSIYRFSNSTKVKDESGEFYEIPVTSLRVSILMNLYFRILKRRYKSLGKFGDGNSIYGSVKDERILKDYFGFSRQSLLSRIGNLVTQRDYVLTPEGNFKEKFYYLIDKAPDKSVMTLHPKNLNFHQLDMIDHVLKKGLVRCISMSELIKEEIVR